MTQTDPVAPPSFLLRWAAILLFIGLPWILILLLKSVSVLPDEFQEKMEAFERRPYFDTIVVGDSRSRTLSEDQFNNRGWTFFNMANIGLSPENVEMSLHFALARRAIRRVIIGVSFENMTEYFPLEFSDLSSRFKETSSSAENTHPFSGSNTVREFRNIGLVDKAENLVSNARFQKLADKVLAKAVSYLNEHVKRASSGLHMFLIILEIKPLPARILLPDGSAAYTELKNNIKSGRYDFRRNQDVGTWWDREDGEVRYIEMGTLSETAKEVYRRIFAALKQEGIPVVVFETGKLPAYQQRIDSDPLLHQLQSEWRAFYRDQQSTCLRFLDLAMLEGVYDPSDFFDAVHFFGPTEHRLTAKVATELGSVESGCFSMVVGRPMATVGE